MRIKVIIGRDFEHPAEVDELNNEVKVVGAWVSSEESLAGHGKYSLNGYHLLLGLSIRIVKGSEGGEPDPQAIMGVDWVWLGQDSGALALPSGVKGSFKGTFL